MSSFVVVMFFSFNKSSVYLHYYFSKIVNAQHATIMWTVCMLIFGLIVENTYYEGIPYIWVFGCPFIILIVMIRDESVFELLMMDSY